MGAVVIFAPAATHIAAAFRTRAASFIHRDAVTVWRDSWAASCGLKFLDPALCMISGCIVLLL